MWLHPIYSLLYILVSFACSLIPWTTLIERHFFEAILVTFYQDIPALLEARYILQPLELDVDTFLLVDSRSVTFTVVDEIDT